MLFFPAGIGTGKPVPRAGKAFAALNNAYGMPHEFTGPIAHRAYIKNGKVFVEFLHSSGMAVHGGSGTFEVEYNDGEIWSGPAILSDNMANVPWMPDKQPLFVRYEWRSDFHITLFNDSGFPASVFRMPVLPEQETY